MIRFEGLGMRFEGGVDALAEIELEVPRGEFCVVLGPSGSGKSTLLRTVNGMLQPTAGVVHFDGTPLSRQTLPAVQRRIGMIHQQFGLVPRASVLDNVLAGAAPDLSTLRVLLRWWPPTLAQRACELLERVALEPGQLYRRVAQLSGGQQQRVAIARAFILRPDVVLADEPVASLDPKTSRDVLELLRQASRAAGATVLCSLHQVDLARAFADRIVALARGRVAFDGPPEAFDEATAAELYA